MFYLITMASQHVNANIAFSEFSKNMSISIFSHILGIFSLLLIISSSIFLLLCYWLLTSSKYIEYYIVQLSINHDSTSIKNVFDNTIQIISDKINQFTPWHIIPASNIKKETSVIYETRINNNDEYTDESADEISDTDVTNNDISDDEISDTDVTKNEISDTDVTNNEISDDEISNTVVSNTTISDGNLEIVIDSIGRTGQDAKQLTENDSDISDIEDITTQYITERERTRDIIDLSDDNE